MVNYQPASLDAAFAALADPTRRAILERLARSAATVSELADPFDMSLPAVSKHLRVLENAGLLARRIEGRTHRIVLSTAPLDEVTRWLEQHRRFWESRLDALEKFLAETRPKQEKSWPLNPPPSPSESSARSRRHPSGSSTRGRKPKRSRAGSRRRKNSPPS
ncbi:MAG: winged helix-turn-helix transcriptional regulator [Candidatus Eisenbacteria bacterium]|uniref:Winged helix-turn-helix transcriptional regulator n=1 Tax=Eiseniibacteriota bacterium TaxID=2212470 RepID=A0A849SGB5_UNCEI|nr:winged helix-turn-helix transcriptional regulator [Candidatus Eisenbacteria bacterium]